MKKLILVFLSFLFVFIGLSQTVKAETFEQATFDVVSYFDDFNSCSNTLINVDYGTRMSFDGSLSSMENYTFMYWLINDVVMYDADITTEFFVTEEIEVKAMFSPNDKHLVLFMDANGEYLGHDYVDDLAAADDSGIVIPDKPGYTVSASIWDEDISSVSTDLICQVDYELESADTYTLTITDDLSTYTQNYAFNETATIAVNEMINPNLEMFQYWEDGDGNIISYFPALFVTVLSEQTYTAVYGLGEAVFSDFVWSEQLELRDGYRTYHMRFEVESESAGYDDVIEFGVLTADLDPGVLTLDTANNIIQGTRIYDSQEFLISVPKDHYYARPYVVYQNESNENVVVYGETYTFDSTKTVYVTDIEDQSKTSYAEGIENLNGRDWTLSQVLIGTATNDRKFDDKSLRFGDNGYIQSVLPFETGIDSIRFQYAKYGSDVDQTFVIKYAYEWAPDVWYTIQEDDSDKVIDVISTDFTGITVNIDIDASIYLRIEKTSSDGDRFNIDNLIVNEMEYVNEAPTITDCTDETITAGDSWDPKSGISAFDFYDGDLIDNVTVTVTDSESNVIADPGDYSGLAAGVYTISYSVQDSGSLSATASCTLTIEEYVAPTQDLFISEYTEGNSYNKAIEIYNPTDQAIDLSNYTLRICSNSGTDWGSDITLSGMLASGDVFVIAHSSANATILAVADQTSGSIDFNGNDDVGLFNSGTLIDSIGQINDNTEFGEDITYIRDATNNTGDNDASNTWAWTGWTSITYSDYSDLGVHTSTLPEV